MIDVMLMQPLMKAVPDRLRRAGGNCQRVVSRVLSLPGGRAGGARWGVQQAL